jgi:tetratricopeptide (TPR) repeat protein
MKIDRLALFIVFFAAFTPAVAFARVDDGAGTRSPDRRKITPEEIQRHLSRLEDVAKTWDGHVTDDTNALVEETRAVQRRRGFIERKDRYLLEGWIHYFSGDFEKTAHWLDRPSRLSGDAPSKSSLSALARARPAAAREERSADAQVEKARALIRAGEPGEAIPICGQALDQIENYPPALSALRQAWTAVMQDQLRTAKDLFDKERYIESRALFLQVLAMLPGHVESSKYVVLINTLLQYRATGRMPDGSEKIRTVYQITQYVNQSILLYHEGNRFDEAGDRAQAVASWRKAFEMAPGNFMAREALKKAENEEENNRWRESRGQPE